MKVIDSLQLPKLLRGLGLLETGNLQGSYLPGSICLALLTQLKLALEVRIVPNDRNDIQ